MKDIPKKYKHSDVENHWMQVWEESAIYAWNEDIDRSNTFVVDTPPPTVSGSLHVGHVFSYTHTDIIVRYQRMRGKNIMYPMGWDDNGLPTERRVQNKFSIRCNPKIAYDEGWKPDIKAKKVSEISRQNFIEACELVTTEDEKAFEDLWRHLGLSVDWSQQYATINSECRKASQLSFLDLLDKGLVYSTEAPTMWDVTFQTALAQADIEDREKPGAYHDISFAIEGGGSFVISTTRPELLVACIAVVAHPEDQRFQGLFGKFAITPLFGAKVPILPSAHADPEKGSGIMMVCTFGDAADVDWWKQSELPIKQVINRAGRFLEIDFSIAPFESEDSDKASKTYAALVGKKIHQARASIVELLAEPDSGIDGKSPALVGEPKPITHPVKFYEKGDLPLEFVTTRQWFVRLLDHKAELLAQGEKISWHPSHMRSRYDNWVEGLAYDWCISRQRFFGVPFPVWYPILENGETDYGNPIFPAPEQLPVDPLSDIAPGYNAEQRDVAGGFTGDPDVMDTWATSSLTPQIVSKWGSDEQRHQRLFPMDMRPQSHEIIRTWAFYTIAKAWFHEREVPWRNVVISGWILDPDRKKMSKSKGNVVTPQHLLEQYSADGVRYWAARARLGVDTAYDESVFKNGQKLATKFFNASKFVLSQVSEYKGDGLSVEDSKIIKPLDVSFAMQLAGSVNRATQALESFDYAQALQISETLFWSFCDSYLELVKIRAYQGEGIEDRGSAIATLEASLGVFVRLFAPYMPYLCEEVWSWYFQQRIGAKSVHLASWPCSSELTPVIDESQIEVFDSATSILGSIHHAKSCAQKSLKWPVDRLLIRGQESDFEVVRRAQDDLESAGRLKPEALVFEVGAVESTKKFEILVDLAQTNDSE